MNALFFAMVASVSLLLFVALFFGYSTSVFAKKEMHQSLSKTPSKEEAESSKTTIILVTTLCRDKCQSGCRHYQTPLQKCFRGATLFPGDPSWNSTYDILDTPLNASYFRRDFYDSGNRCQGEPSDNGSFELPYQVCVGPFGKPRPWGTFQILSAEDLLVVQE